MGLSAKGGQLTTPTSTGNSAVTGLGFQPKVVVLYSTLVSDANAYSPCLGVGASSSARWALSAYADVNVGTGWTARLMDSTKAFRCVTNVGGAGFATFVAADFVSLDSDGFTLNWTTVQASGYPVNYICLGGSDLSVNVGTFDTNSSTGNQAVTGVGFQPKAMLFGAGDLASIDVTGTTSSGHIGIGVACSSSARSALSSAEETGGTSATGGVLRTDKCWQWTYPKTTTYGDADFVSMDSDGFTVNITTVTAASVFRVGYLALGGTAQFKTSTFAQPGSTGNQAITGVGFQPTCTLFWTGGKTSSNSLSIQSRFGFGASVSDTDARTLYAAAKDGQSNQAEVRAIYTKSIAVYQDDAPSVLAQSDFVSQDSDGFTNNWTNVDATARVMGYLAIGAAAAAGKRFVLIPG